jgi:threonine dehydratase
MIPLPEIRAAAERLAGTVHRTPTLSAESIGARAGVVLQLKCECFQKTGSFKPRGALNKVLSLSAADRATLKAWIEAGAQWGTGSSRIVIVAGGIGSRGGSRWP